MFHVLALLHMVEVHFYIVGDGNLNLIDIYPTFSDMDDLKSLLDKKKRQLNEIAIESVSSTLPHSINLHPHSERL
jgi:hypothetical protein